MGLKIVNGLFILACAVIGGLWAWFAVPMLSEEAVYDASLIPWALLGTFIGGALSVAILLLLGMVTQEMFERISPALMAIVLALVAGFVVGQFIFEFYLPDADPVLRTVTISGLLIIFGFVGVYIGLTRASNWESLIRAVHRREYQDASPKIVDTSVIIDGRIVDVCQTGFIEGSLLVPRFVLKELQNIADSSDVLRRARGRRGLDILKQLQDPESRVSVEVVEEDPQDVEEVDGKLVRLSRDYNAKILTNDLNLNKVAQIEGVDVLNINDLANALKPAVLPDELMEVKIVKQGKEAQQGVGYLDDGTMVVVDNGRPYVGKDVTVVVTSVLQTSAGRMIFTKLHNVLS